MAEIDEPQVTEGLNLEGKKKREIDAAVLGPLTFLFSSSFTTARSASFPSASSSSSSSSSSSPVTKTVCGMTDSQSDRQKGREKAIIGEAGNNAELLTKELN